MTTCVTIFVRRKLLPEQPGRRGSPSSSGARSPTSGGESISCSPMAISSRLAGPLPVRTPVGGLGSHRRERRAEFSGVNIFRFGDDGKVTEIWNHRDDLGLMEQLGAAVYAGAGGDEP